MVTKKIDTQAAKYLSYMFIFGALSISFVGIFKLGDATGAIVLFLWAAVSFLNKKVEEKKPNNKKYKGVYKKF
jgi:hypothetical protein